MNSDQRKPARTLTSSRSEIGLTRIKSTKFKGHLMDPTEGGQHPASGHDPVVIPTLLPVDDRSPVPLYHQVAERIRTAVQSKVLQEGRIIGPEKQLARDFYVSLPTLRRALELLASEGIIVRKRGLGTIVAGKVRHRPLGVVRHNEPDTDQSRCSVVSVKKTAPDAVAKERLHLTDGEQVWRVVRLEQLHDMPTAILEDYLCSEPTPHDHARFNEAGADAPLVSAQDRTRMAQHEIKARGANGWLAQTLRVDPEAPLIVLERTVFGDAGKPVEFGRHSYLADHYKFQATFSTTGTQLSNQPRTPYDQVPIHFSTPVL
jgi:GntR family transcriptional regulator